MLMDLMRNRIENKWGNRATIMIDLFNHKDDIGLELHMTLPYKDALELNIILTNYREMRRQVSTMKLIMIQDKVTKENVSVWDCIDSGGGLD